MLISRVIRLFPFWAVLASLLAYYAPHWFTPWKPAVVPLLGIVMFGMGVTLTVGNFLQVMKRPQWIGMGVLLQFGLMPLFGWLLAELFELTPYAAAGVILVGSCPGGTASNVVCYLAHGDVALSITLTAVTTLLAVVATPVLTWFYIGQTVPVPVLSMLLSILKIVLLPVLLGVLINKWFGERLHLFKQCFPLISVIAIVVIIAIIVALNRDQMRALALVLGATVILHNLLGLAAGYWISRWAGFERQQARTLAIEVGMQNSGLAVALASQYFTAAAALPGAIFSIWHNLSGALLAGYWARKEQ